MEHSRGHTFKLWWQDRESHSQEAKRSMMYPASFLLLFFPLQSGISVRRRVSCTSEWIFLLQLVLSSVKYLREWKHTHKYDQKCLVSGVTSNTVERTMKINHPLCHVVFSFVCVLGHGQISTNTFMASNFTFYDT